MKWSVLSTLVTLMTVVSAISLISLPDPIPPSQDPFYMPRAGYEDLALGEIINFRKVTNPFGVIIFEEHIAAAYQLLVRSEDSFGNATAIVTTVMVPYNADPTKILSYQAAVDSPNGDCAPSYAMQLGSDPSTWITAQIEQLLAEGGLYDGWYLVVPDFLGPKAALAAGIQAGHATLDSLRGVLKSGNLTGVSPNAEIVLWGYSGGSQPTIWSAAQAPTYAPELKIAGAAAGGILVDPRHIAEVSMGKIWAGLVIESINGLANEYPEFSDYLEEILYPDVKAKFYAAKGRCLIDNILHYIDTSWDDISPYGAAVLNSSVVLNVSSANNLLDLDQKPNVPLFFYNSQNDEIIPASDTDELYNKWCAEGVSIEYRQDYLSEHVTQAVFGAGDAFVWLQDRFKGVPQTGCKKEKSVSNLLNSNAISGLATLLADIVYTVLGDHVGPATKNPINFNTKYIKGSPYTVVSALAAKIGSLSISTSSSLTDTILGFFF